MNKKILSSIVLGATVSCAVATGILADSFEFVRSSGSPAAVLDNTKAARNSSLRPAAAATITDKNILADDEGESVILLDNVPAYQEKIYNYVVNDLNNDNYTWTIENNTWDAYSYLEIYPYYNGEDLNDWVFIPFEVPDGGGKISLSLLASTSYSNGHNFKIAIGKDSDPSAMTTELASREDYGTSGLGWTYVKEPIEGSAIVADGGKYWLGILATSKKDAYKLRMRDITLTLSPAAVTPPATPGDVFTMHPTEDEFAACTVIDGNNDGCKITYDVHEGLDGSTFDWPIAYNKAKSPAATADADEWIITPAVTLTEINRLYTASIEADATTNVASESFQIVIAKAADIASMRAGKIIMNEPYVTGNGYMPYSSKFGITEPGDYYFGIHITSTLDEGWRLMLRNFTVTLTDMSSDIPAACTDLTLTPDATGELQLTAEFNLPTTYINGTEIPSSETIQAEIATSAATETVSGAPGQRVSKTLQAADGSNVVTVTPFNDNGKGIELKGVVVCGIGVPSNPLVSSSVSDDNMSLQLSWEPVSTSASGGVINPENTVYNIYQYTTSDNVGQWVCIEQNVTECKYTYTVADETQQLYQLMVSAKNEKGESEGGQESYASAMLGKPHEMPVNENFPDKSMKYSGLLIDYPEDNYTAEWALDSPSLVGASGGPEYALICLCLDASSLGYGYAELPKISTIGCSKPRVRLLTYINSSTPETTIRIHSTEGRGNGVVLGVITPASGEGWSEITYDIPERYYNKSWIVISADVKCESTEQMFILGEYNVYESVANDLALTQLTAPSYVTLGNDLEFKATLQNRGTNNAVTPELKAQIYVDDEPVNTIDLTHTAATLGENDKAEYTGKLRIEKVEMAARDFTIYITLPDTDEDPTNNAVSASFRVGLGDLPVATDLQANGTDDNDFVNLSWSEPFADGYVDKIESYEHGCYDYNLGDWKNIDFDKGDTYYSEGFNIPDAGTPKAFQVVNAITSGIEAQGGMGQPSGDSFLMAFSPMGSTADDWLISPKVTGGTTLSFCITSLSSSYTESVEVMVSTTDDELDSFSVLDKIELTSAGWGLYSITLPNDAKYFAIHYTSTDMFGICMDDIAYTPEEAPFEITGWNIYRDGILISQSNTGTSFTDEIPDGALTYNYNVAATGTRKGVAMEFPLSNTAQYYKYASIANISNDNMNITVEKGAVKIDGYQDKRVEIADIQGMIHYNAASAPDKVTVRLNSGFYIVSIDGKSQKVMVP